MELIDYTATQLQGTYPWGTDVHFQHFQLA